MVKIQESLEPQQCFYSDGFMYCNYVVRNNAIIKGRKGWIKFPVQNRNKNKITIPNEIVTMSN